MKRIALALAAALALAGGTAAQEGTARLIECRVTLYATDDKSGEKAPLDGDKGGAVFQAPEGRTFTLKLDDPKATFQARGWRLPTGDLRLTFDWKAQRLDLQDLTQPFQVETVANETVTLQPDVPVTVPLGAGTKPAYAVELVAKVLPNLLDRHPGLVGDLVLATRSPDLVVQQRAKLTLFQIGRETLGTLIEGLNSEDPALRVNACQLIAELVRRRTDIVGYEDLLVDSLRRSLRDEDPAVHQASAETLAVVLVGDVDGAPNTSLGASYRVR